MEEKKNEDNIPNSGKKIIKAEGTIMHFRYDDENKSLFFDGTNLEDGSHIKRNIKLSRHVKGYDENHVMIPVTKFPEREKIYTGKLLLKSWEWNDFDCLKVVYFEIDRCMGKNRYYEKSPFEEED